MQIKFTKTHEWLKKINETEFQVGVTKYAQEALHDIVNLELPNKIEVGKQIKKDEIISILDSTKTSAEVLMPIDGEITKINNNLIAEIKNIGSNISDQWIIQIKPPIPSDKIDELMSEEDYIKYTESKN